MRLLWINKERKFNFAMGEVITIQVGQCGNQIGTEFWDKVCLEHGIARDGRGVEKSDRKDVFFYQSDDGRYVPRALLVDLEPRVVTSVMAERGELFARENVFLSNEGGGAGNNWAHGYGQGEECKEAIMDMLQREAEGSEFLGGFILFHSIAGGTGSGLGSFLLEEIRSEFGLKKKIEAVSIFPNNEETSDVVVQPYNSVLALKRLKEHCDGVIAMDNGALGRVAADALRISNPTFSHTNKLASIVASASTSTIRFPGSRFSDFSTLLAMASPIGGCHFLVPSYSPFLESGFRAVRKATCLDVQRRLLLPKSRLVTYEESETNCLLAGISIMEGASSGEIERSLLRLNQRGALRFAPWTTASIQVALGNGEGTKVSGLLLSNTTGFARTLKKTTKQFDTLKKKNAFVEMYRREGHVGENLEEFAESREAVQWIIDEYEAAELSSYKF
jgi:tubulin gamma